MTDRQQLEALFKRAGIVFTMTGRVLTVNADDNAERSGVQPGYPGFETVFTFAEDGALIQIGAWE